VADLAFRRGNLRDAEAHASTALDGPGQDDLDIGRHFALSVLVDALVERGELVAAERELARCACLDPDLARMAAPSILLFLARARLRLARGRVDLAVPDSAGMVDWCEAQHLNPALRGEAGRGRGACPSR
jgi:hypothetical protein